MLFAEFAQTEEEPVIQLEIAALTLTVFVLVELQVPLEVVKVSVKEHVEVLSLIHI